jgi:hypothetical protein
MSTTTLTISSSTVALHTEVTLTASVTANGAPVTTGSITFCDLSGPYTRCEDAAVVGMAQLNGTPPTATFAYFPGPGPHNYTAMFSGTTAAAVSTSAAQPLAGLYPTTTAIAATGGPSGYDLTATVVSFASQPPVLAGSVTFQDTTNINDLQQTVPLGTPVLAQTLSAAPGSPVQTGNAPSNAGVGDFNEDGIRIWRL